MLELTSYARKPFFVKAVQVTPQNMEELATWTKGEIKTEGKGQYIHVPVERAANDRQSKAFVGDWVLLADQGNNGFKVYTPKAFINSFEKVETTVAAPTTTRTAVQRTRPKPGPVAKSVSAPVPPDVTPVAAEAPEVVADTVVLVEEPVVTFSDGS